MTIHEFCHKCDDLTIHSVEAMFGVKKKTCANCLLMDFEVIP